MGLTDYQLLSQVLKGSIELGLSYHRAIGSYEDRLTVVMHLEWLPRADKWEKEIRSLVKWDRRSVLQGTASREHIGMNASRDIILRVIEYLTSNKESCWYSLRGMWEAQRSTFEESIKDGNGLKDSLAKSGRRLANTSLNMELRLNDVICFGEQSNEKFSKAMAGDLKPRSLLWFCRKYLPSKISEQNLFLFNFS